jgi:hypothetical protein
MTTTTTTETAMFTGVPIRTPGDDMPDLLKVSKQTRDGRPVLLVEVGSIEDGETAEQLFGGELISTVCQIELAAEDLVSHALTDDPGERRDALVRFTERVVARSTAAAT